MSPATYSDQDLIYQLALSKINGLGPRSVKQILGTFHCARALFEEKRENLELVFAKQSIIDSVCNRKMFAQCEQELLFMKQYGIKMFALEDENYPFRLKNIADSPVCLFVLGKDDILDSKRIVSIVGTRQATPYGRIMTEKIVSELKKYGVIIVSGLAYGIDSTAHKASLDNSIPTFGVLGHGLDTMYPASHVNLATQMQSNGGLITEYFTKTLPRGYNFPARNRIIAGLSDVVIVIEAAKKGGALSTARFGNDYDREVFAVPGRCGDKYSEGCNFLIESNRANIFSSVENFAALLSWDNIGQSNSLFDDLLPAKQDKLSKLQGNDKTIYNIIKGKEQIDIDTLITESKLPASDVSVSLFNLELSDIIAALPGKVYKIL